MAHTTAQAHRFAFLSDVREDLLTHFGNAEDWLFIARGTPREADAQGEYARAEAELNAWLESDEGNEWDTLDSQRF